VSKSEGESPSPAKGGPGRPPGSGTGSGNGKRGRALLHAVGVIQKEFLEGSWRFGKKIYQDKATGKWVVRLTDNGKEVGNEDAKHVLSYDDPVKAYDKYKSLTKERLKPLIKVWK
jgi:hypothetical protein